MSRLQRKIAICSTRSPRPNNELRTALLGPPTEAALLACKKRNGPADRPGELHISIRNPRIKSISCGSLVFFAPGATTLGLNCGELFWQHPIESLLNLTAALPQRALPGNTAGPAVWELERLRT